MSAIDGDSTGPPLEKKKDPGNGEEARAKSRAASRRSLPQDTLVSSRVASSTKEED
jgi:hypothetical protein